jgi:hypothetical protein
MFYIITISRQQGQKPKLFYEDLHMIGQLAKESGFELKLEVLESGAGFYIGTFDYNPSDYGPFSRESEEYFTSKEEAQRALEKGTWTQRTGS